jgi:hypothetical protein
MRPGGDYSHFYSHQVFRLAGKWRSSPSVRRVCAGDFATGLILVQVLLVVATDPRCSAGLAPSPPAQQGVKGGDQGTPGRTRQDDEGPRGARSGYVGQAKTEADGRHYRQRESD